MNTPFVFFGSYKFAYTVLSDLISAGMIPSLIVCNVDKPIGRKQVLTPPPVKELALQHNIPFIQPIGKPSASDVSMASGNASFAIVAAYAHLIPQESLSVFSRGVIGVHPSLLPLYRGASPIQTVLLHNDAVTGVSLYKMDNQMDHGPIVVQKAISIDTQDTYASLEEKLAHLGGSLLIEAIPRWLEGSIQPQEQNHSQATYTQKFITEDGRVDLHDDLPESIARKIRALAHDPGVFTFIDGKRTKLLQIQNTSEAYIITRIIPEGRKEQDAHIVLKK